jgi:hypothetical protein
MTLLGLDRAGAIEHLARAARSADRLDSPHVLDDALRQLAILSAEAGLTARSTREQPRGPRRVSGGYSSAAARLERVLPSIRSSTLRYVREWRASAPGGHRDVSIHRHRGLDAHVGRSAP